MASSHFPGAISALLAPRAVYVDAGDWRFVAVAGFLVLVAVGAVLWAGRLRVRAALLREQNATQSELLAKRTSELEELHRQYQQLSFDLRRTRQDMAVESEACKAAQQRFEHEKDEQQRLIRELEDTHRQLLQSEKLASIGQLAAGVAHEINNPISFVYANLNTLSSWVKGLLDLIADFETKRGQAAEPKAPVATAMVNGFTLGDVRNEIMVLVDESLQGTMRVRRIVRDLRNFSRPSSEEWGMADLHAGLDSTLNVVCNEIKYKASVVRDYGDLPAIECNADQLNQVFMNLLVNAAQAIRKQGTITIRTRCQGGTVSVSISDTGEGIPADVIGRIFDPFFTTKPVGEGTGLGLSISHGIIEHHGGRIEVESRMPEGTTFIVTLPVRRGGEYPG